METASTNQTLPQHSSFKSYYVVWKHEIGHKIYALKKFKSYYVVWKQRVRTFKFFQDMKFKSYYVVWKHDVKASTVKKLKRLNRTM